MEIYYLLILRDNYGITQCIIDKENSNFKELEKYSTRDSNKN